MIAAALSSLKGPKHGGANIKVVEMMQDLRKNVDDISDESAAAITEYVSDPEDVTTWVVNVELFPPPCSI